MRIVTYLTIRPAAFTCWPLLVCPFSLLNFSLFPEASESTNSTTALEWGGLLRLFHS